MYDYLTDCSLFRKNCDLEGGTHFILESDCFGEQEGRDTISEMSKGRPPEPLDFFIWTVEVCLNFLMDDSWFSFDF